MEVDSIIIKESFDAYKT